MGEAGGAGRSPFGQDGELWGCSCKQDFREGNGWTSKVALGASVL